MSALEELEGLALPIDEVTQEAWWPTEAEVKLTALLVSSISAASGLEDFAVEFNETSFRIVTAAGFGKWHRRLREGELNAVAMALEMLRDRGEDESVH